jgi:hypothetical protein
MWHSVSPATAQTTQIKTVGIVLQMMTEWKIIMCKLFQATPSTYWAFEDRVTMQNLLASFHSKFLGLISPTIQVSEDCPASLSTS